MDDPALPLDVLPLDGVFHALSDPTRRAMLQALASGPHTVGALAAPFEISLAAASKHVRALERAGLLARQVQGRTHRCTLQATGLAQALAWLKACAVAVPPPAPAPMPARPAGGPPMALTHDPVARATMLIRRPPAEVFAAFVDPAVTTRFWFSRASGPLAPGATVTWHWDDYGASGEVRVVALEPGERIAIEWPTPVEWRFTPHGDDATFVAITASGFTGSDDEKVAQALDSTEGFNLVVAACKAWLEHGIDLRLVADKAPDAHVGAAPPA
ncbi:metalloregulator ArsR/SmtB family transcription factor [Luteimonas kalidii]|uniref:Metalloregulator ArsR/SmtB family transcription factor n=1 Tax=Luteimonas kalidii TaxID=3042025 RepID=A0ABT6JS89_9GAMM|nr:metalloregulator ArsR/SmtB family transcription factor [Luteimonas kalidii]MDH5833011.1 metalloregulator ArsR/SmtB family transcription factor [Luteimonas kalidii]